MASRAVPSLQSLNSWDSISYLSQREAAEIDDILMGPLGFSVVQLMVYRSTEYNRVLTICGPGNNGSDGRVAARHLHHFGYKLSVCYPKRAPKPLYDGLVTQLESPCVPFLSVEDLSMDLSNDFDILVDAMFGFSFRGTPRPPFDVLIQRPISIQNHHRMHQESPIVVSIDIPSGWHVEEGDINGEGIKPDMLFKKWFADAVAASLREPNAMALSTAGKDRKPYTNYESRKAYEISENPHASLLFYWDGLHRQARVEGFLEKVSDEESEQYFHSHLRGSQIGAIVSKQVSFTPLLPFQVY
ncbi:pyridoxine/pyridoxamine 5'-phosphate oxidase 1, chloroplastic-like [Camellia sinensis]|uniref:pyridoxine/pyridoxamine 5'-phosphate oxidase 1, chloroplastic-like n=1 Tax=Camellia sinensis TaxID=4442 RepID=UPI0010361813|nr:pyridoxine/pyridoxamine 5'-phosphate oxidase 1, chloroplastic-like [Camellia sinensis]